MQRVFDCICRFVVSFLLRFGQRICEGQRPYAVTKANTKLCALNNIIINSQFFFCSFIEFAPFLFVIAPQVHHCHWGYCHDLIDARSQIAIQLSILQSRILPLRKHDSQYGALDFFIAVGFIFFFFSIEIWN